MSFSSKANKVKTTATNSLVENDALEKSVADFRDNYYLKLGRKPSQSLIKAMTPFIDKVTACYREVRKVALGSQVHQAKYAIEFYAARDKFDEALINYQKSKLPKIRLQGSFFEFKAVGNGGAGVHQNPHIPKLDLTKVQSSHLPRLNGLVRKKG